ncbi:hypothetical protein SUGI_0454630 [Cryptomeria japonica]|nr:hypothetical protein SUGI_0454630 [Cryptomeria japonica]
MTQAISDTLQAAPQWGAEEMVRLQRRALGGRWRSWQGCASISGTEVGPTDSGVAIVVRSPDRRGQVL